MLTTFYKGISIDTIIQSIPADQIQHMVHVGKLVEILSVKIDECSLYETTVPFEKFGKAAVYHDIGKVRIPQQILLKCGSLTHKEYCLLQKHPLYADELFKLISSGYISGMPQSLLALARDAALYHHERFDGQGYPYGMKENTIPLIARITAVCDAYDAMTNDRSYRKALSHDVACCEIARNAGSQFDPSLVHIFLAYGSQFKVN